jgi:hypothetical protein
LFVCEFFGFSPAYPWGYQGGKYGRKMDLFKRMPVALFAAKRD